MDLETPREINDNMHAKWTREIEVLLSEWGEISLSYAWLHQFSTRKYQQKNRHFAIPIIILSSLAGTANFADAYVPEGFQMGFSACVGSVNIFCAILGTLQSFLKYAELYESHRMSALSWASLGRSIQIELALNPERRKPCREFLKVSRAQMDSLLESSPTLDQDVITLFNKKFNVKYPNVTKPLVCNGLQEVKIWAPETSDDDMASVIENEP
jgi:hypothetical protein